MERRELAKAALRIVSSWALTAQFSLATARNTFAAPDHSPEQEVAAQVVQGPASQTGLEPSGPCNIDSSNNTRCPGVPRNISSASETVPNGSTCYNWRNPANNSIELWCEVGTWQNRVNPQGIRYIPGPDGTLPPSQVNTTAPTQTGLLQRLCADIRLCQQHNQQLVNPNTATQYFPQLAPQYAPQFVAAPQPLTTPLIYPNASQPPNLLYGLPPLPGSGGFSENSGGQSHQLVQSSAGLMTVDTLYQNYLQATWWGSPVPVFGR